MISTPSVETGAGAQIARLDFGGAVWEIRSMIREMRLELDLRTREFQSIRTGSANVVIKVEWAESLDVADQVLFDVGIWRSSPAGDGLQFDFFTERLGSAPYKRAIFAREFNFGRVQLNRQLLSNLDSYYPLEYPLDELVCIHRLGLGHGVELHSCGLATGDGRGFLFVGHSGAGKSTLGKQWVKHRGATILSDDRMVVTNDDRGFVIHGTPWHGEAGLAKNASARLQAIFLIEHGEANETVAMERNRSSAELLSRSFVPWYRRQNLDFTLTFLQRLTAVVPVYVFRCLPDVSAVEYLERVHAI